MRAGFSRNAERALQLAEQQVQAHPNDADSHYQLGSTIGLMASYSATIDGRIFAAFTLARRTYKENPGALAIDPRRHDAGLIVGVYAPSWINDSIGIADAERLLAAPYKP